MAFKFCNSDVNQIQNLADDINNGASPQDIFKKNEWAPYAFAAFHQKLVSRSQLTSLLMQWAALEQFGMMSKVHSIFSDTVLSDDANKYLIPALYKLSSKETEGFTEEMQKVELSERKFTVVYIDETRTKKNGENNFQEKEMGALDFFARNFYFLKYQQPTELKEKGLVAIVIPSFSILQAYLNAVFKQNTVHLEPEFLTTTAENIELDLVQNRRPLAMPFPNIRNVLEADGEPFGIYGTIFHDIYHALRLATVPIADRLGRIRQIDRVRHCIMLSQKYPDKPLLTVYYEGDKYSRYDTRRVFKYPALDEKDMKFKEEVIDVIRDMEGPSARYYRPWVSIRNSSWEKEIEPKRTIISFAHTFSGSELHPLNSKKMRFWGSLIHDMVVHEEKWLKSFNLDVSQKNSEWKFCDDYWGMRDTIYYGFKGAVGKNKWD